jgi:hypothetical protein
MPNTTLNEARLGTTRCYLDLPCNGKLLDQENLVDTTLEDYKDSSQSSIAIETALSKKLVF